MIPALANALLSTAAKPLAAAGGDPAAFAVSLAGVEAAFAPRLADRPELAGTGKILPQVRPVRDDDPDAVGADPVATGAGCRLVTLAPVLPRTVRDGTGPATRFITPRKQAVSEVPGEQVAGEPAPRSVVASSAADLPTVAPGPIAGEHRSATPYAGDIPPKLAEPVPEADASASARSIDPQDVLTRPALMIAGRHVVATAASTPDVSAGPFAPDRPAPQISVEPATARPAPTRVASQPIDTKPASEPTSLPIVLRTAVSDAASPAAVAYELSSRAKPPITARPRADIIAPQSGLVPVGDEVEVAPGSDRRIEEAAADGHEPLQIRHTASALPSSISPGMAPISAPAPDLGEPLADTARKKDAEPATAPGVTREVVIAPTGEQPPLAAMSGPIDATPTAIGAPVTAPIPASASVATLGASPEPIVAQPGIAIPERVAAPQPANATPPVVTTPGFDRVASPSAQPAIDRPNALSSFKRNAPNLEPTIAWRDQPTASLARAETSFDTLTAGPSDSAARLAPGDAPSVAQPIGREPQSALQPNVSRNAPASQPLAPELADISAEPAPAIVERRSAHSPAPTATTTPVPARALPSGPAGQVFADLRRGMRDARLLTLDAAVTAPAAPVETRAPHAAEAATPTIDLRQERWPSAMIERIERMRDDVDAADTRVRLVPDVLGAIEVDVRQDGDTLHVRFTAEQSATRTLLEEAAPRLAEAAEARGLKLGQTAVGADGAGGDRRQPHQPPSANPARPRAASASSDAHGSADHRTA
jgi:hypothetical protein